MNATDLFTQLNTMYQPLSRTDEGMKAWHSAFNEAFGGYDDEVINRAYKLILDSHKNQRCPNVAEVADAIAKVLHADPEIAPAHAKRIEADETSSEHAAMIVSSSEHGRRATQGGYAAILEEIIVSRNLGLNTITNEIHADCVRISMDFTLEMNKLETMKTDGALNVGLRACYNLGREIDQRGIKRQHHFEEAHDIQR